MEQIKRCNVCIMDDSSDNTIMFDENGQCNYCKKAFSRMENEYLPDAAGQKKLEALLAEVKKNGIGKPYDCIMGLSGGLDSSYLAYLGYKWGLRVLAVHIDDGFDTEISKNNLRKLVAATGFDYRVITPDAEQFNALTLAYMRAGVPNIAIPQDNVLFAFIYDLMRKEHIRYFLSGSNFALECILQQGNTYKAFDVVNLKSINKAFGEKPIDKLKFISTLRSVYDKMSMKTQTPCPLNYIDYNRDRAFRELEEFCGFEYYGRKHLENVLTAFIQLYWFPKKFGVDKRTSHLSSMIVSGQMTRDEALAEYAKPLYDEAMMKEYIDFVKQKLGISDVLFEELMAAQPHQHTDYKTQDQLLVYRLLKALRKLYDR